MGEATITLIFLAALFTVVTIAELIGAGII
jgi:hypothetical protein